MSWLLSSDWHLTDSPADEYRWAVFDAILAVKKRKGFDALCILGDLCDRKDRHSSVLVNRLVSALQKLVSSGIELHILMGNHDMPLQGPPFWQFLGNMNVNIVTKPFAHGDLLLLPYASNPVEAWRDIPLHRYHGIFMHQTVTGALADNGIPLQNDKMPKFPRGVRVYSGDLHVPQVAGAVTYIGAPHPIDFGDSYPCRMLRLDQEYHIAEEIKLTPPQKHMFDVASLDELEATSTHRGDQARVRLTLPLAAAEQWPAMQDAIGIWATQRGVTLASIEAKVELAVKQDVTAPAFMIEDEEALLSFAEAESIDDRMLEAGIALLEEAKGLA